MRLSSELSHQTTEFISAKVGLGLTLTGSSGAVVSGSVAMTTHQVAEAGMTLADWGIAVGIFTALVGLGVQAYFGWDRRVRERELHERRMRWMDEADPNHTHHSDMP